ncbi:hypothetical protein FRB95_013409 [Tulasnella sp. JGI-2019a]|nr:hypothetical protein FRB95_013409 [Tulasnella sp. JGI-2019a]
MDGRTLNQVIELVSKKATDEPRWSKMYAKLCEKMLEDISPDVSDEGLYNPEGKPIAGRQLFSKYLTDRCQKDFERIWNAVDTAVALAVSEQEGDDAKAARAAAVARAGCQEGEVPLYSEEYYAALKAKGRAVGLITFIGELFKLHLLTERIVGECIGKLLTEIEHSRAEHEIMSLCKLMTIVGYTLDSENLQNRVDQYFTRMDTVAKQLRTGSQMQYALLDVIDLRSRNWTTMRASNVTSDTTSGSIPTQGIIPMVMGSVIRGGRTWSGSSGIGGIDPDGKPPNSSPATTHIPLVKAGDLSQFGRIAKSGGMMAMGPSSVFKKGERARGAGYRTKPSERRRP